MSYRLCIDNLGRVFILANGRFWVEMENPHGKPGDNARSSDRFSTNNASMRRAVANEFTASLRTIPLSGNQDMADCRPGIGDNLSAPRKVIPSDFWMDLGPRDGNGS